MGNWRRLRSPSHSCHQLPISLHSCTALWKVGSEKSFSSMSWFFIFSCLTMYFCFLCLTEGNNSHCIISSSVILSSLQTFQVLKYFVLILFPLLCILWVSFFFSLPYLTFLARGLVFQFISTLQFLVK